MHAGGSGGGFQQLQEEHTLLSDSLHIRMEARRDHPLQADVHPLLLPSAPAHPTVKKPQILGNFSTPQNEAGVLPMHTKRYFFSLKQLLLFKAGSLTKSHKWIYCFSVFSKENTCVHVGGKAQAPRKRTHVKPIISSQCNFPRTGRDLG